MECKREVQQISINHSLDIDFKHFMKLCKKYNKKSHSSLVNDSTLTSD